jgi:tetratricopeptide (TPR) repeat protein
MDKNYFGKDRLKRIK